MVFSMNQKPYNQKKSGNLPRAYEPELLEYSPFNSGKYWKQLLVITLVPAAVMVAVTILLELRWPDVSLSAIGAAMVALLAWMIYHAKKGQDYFREIVAKGEYVPESTVKNQRSVRFTFIISLLFPLVFILFIVLQIASSLHGRETTNFFPYYLFIFPYLAFTNNEISDIVFMPDGFYTGTATGGMYFIPYTKIDAITDEGGRTTKRGETVKIKLFTKGRQFGHDRLYRTELNEIRRRVVACHGENENSEEN